MSALSMRVRLESGPVICLIAFVIGWLISLANLVAVQWLYLGRSYAELSYALSSTWLGGMLFAIGAFVGCVIHILFGRTRRSSVFRSAPATRPHPIERYFFRKGGRLSLGICRIALFSSLLFLALSVHDFFEGYGGIESYLALNPPAWRSFSILTVLFGKRPPDPGTVQFVLVLAVSGSICAILGILTPIAMAVGVIGCWILAALTYAYLPTFSHGYNVALLAAFAFLFAPAGSVLAVDSSLNRRFAAYPFGRAVPKDEYLWPVLIGQAAVALFYFAAFYAKIGYSGYLWAFSDNLRFSLAGAWLHPLASKPMTSLVDWISRHEIAFVTVAILHLLSQAMTILAIFSIDRPYARFVEGMFFVAGVVGLNVFMADIWPVHWWLPLTAFFVDWDFFWARYCAHYPRQAAVA